MKKYLAFLACILITAAAFAQNKATAEMESALQRIETASEENNAQALAEAFCDVAELDMASYLDEEAEKNATKAEDIARKKHFDALLARALIIKANICSYAETDSLFNRNDEGLAIIQEALSIAEKIQSDTLQMEACCTSSQLYINKNRWNKKINMEWYELAGEYLKRAQMLAPKVNYSNSARFLAYWIRYYRQNHCIKESISYCEQAFEKSQENDYLLKSQICEQLVPLYMEDGKYQEASDAHSSFVHYSKLYSQQREEDKILELQYTYEAKLNQEKIQRKTFQILFLCAIIALFVLLACVLSFLLSREKKRRKQAELDNLAKQELMEFIANDLKNPINQSVGIIKDFISKTSSLSEEQVKEESRKLIEDEHNLSHEVANYVSDLVLSKQKRASEFSLSARELEIVHLSLDGLNTARIADHLHISTRTVSNHKAKIYEKMKVSSKAEMIQKAKETGL